MLYQRLFFTLNALLGSIWLSAQCIGVQNCPTNQDTLAICIMNSDQSALWNHPVFYNQVTGTNNLFEGEAALSVNVIYTPNCSTPIDTRFELFLDLDGNGSQETVVQSWALPPAGAVLYNNVTDPQNSGTLVSYDNRPVPLNQKYQFSAQLIPGAGAMAATLKFSNAVGGNMEPALLPNGIHQIRWTFTSANGESATCTQTFQVKDCAGPVVACDTGLSVDIMPGTPPSLELWATDILAGVLDNVSASSDIQVEIREYGSGSSYANSAILNCADLGTVVMQLRATDQSGNSTVCWGEVLLEDAFNVCGGNGPEQFSFCLRRWCDGALVGNIDSLILGGQTILDPQNCATSYPAPSTGPYTASLAKNGDLLNGVTVLDAWHIIGHILGISPLTSPFSILAADVNQSNSVTTFDVVQILRAISGLPHSILRPSWTVLDSVSLTNQWTSPNSGGTHLEVPFIAIKTADIDCDGAPGFQQPGIETRDVARLTVPNETVNTGDIFEVPVQWEVSGDWLCFQFGLLYDTLKLQLLGFNSKLDDNYGMINTSIPGSVNLAWLDVNPVFFPKSDSLITLRFKALAPLQLLDVLELYSSTEAINGTLSIGYKAQQEAFDLVLAGVSSTQEGVKPLFELNSYPNPSKHGEEVVLQISSQQTGSGLLQVMDASGKICYQRTVELTDGLQTITVPGAAFPAAAGWYTWRLSNETGIISGKITRW